VDDLGPAAATGRKFDPPTGASPDGAVVEHVLAGPAVDAYGERRERFATVSNLDGDRLYTPLDIADTDYETELSFPGEEPYTRGVYPAMYPGRQWTMRQFAGFGTAQETNERFQYLIDEDVQEHQRERLATVRADRDDDEVAAALVELRATVDADENVLPAIVTAVKAQATMGEIMDVFRAQFGEYRETL